MKKNIIIFAGIGFIILLSYLQWGREVKICSSRVLDMGEYCSQNITVVANTLYIIDKEEFAKEMMQKYIDNSFNEIKFRYRSKYTNDLTITVYLNKISWKYGKKSFEIHFVQDEKFDERYYIRENPEKFKMEIK